MRNDRGAGGGRGRTVGGRYRLLDRIGSGGMGTVWRAHDELVDREVAVKEPRLPGDPGDESHRRAAHRLYREARAAARVDHPCAVAVHDVVVEEDDGEDGLPWIVMELVRGESLHEVLKRGPLEPAEAARVGLAVLGALRAAHAVGIVHRDVKPANVLMGRHGRVVLTDFGIAHVQGEESLTASGEFIGSLEFIAPERMSGRRAGPPSDLWSLGVLLYAAVEGWSPFRRTTLESTLAAILAAEVPEPKQAGPLAPLIGRLLVKEPALRPDAAATEAALAAAAGEEPSPGGYSAWPAAGPGQGTQEAAEAQDTSALREFGDDVRTARLGATGDAGATGTAGTTGDGGDSGENGGVGEVGGDGGDGDAADTDDLARDAGVPGAGAGAGASGAEVPGTEVSGAADSGAGASETPAPVPISTPASPSPLAPRRPLHRRPVPLALLGGLLAGALWFSTSVLVGPDSDAAAGSSPGAATGPSRSPSPSPSVGSGPGGSPVPLPEGWLAHPEPTMSATLVLPAAYEEYARQGNAKVQPRVVEYSAGFVQVHLTQWDTAPGTPKGQAMKHARTWKFLGDGDATTSYTPTTFHGWEAMQCDTTYGEGDLRRRLVELLVVTDDERFYELRVEMPKDEAAERQGLSVFKAARDRLLISDHPDN
ncbi:serine/threonine-protein kinase [Streptomyces sp. bgisy154]|uniref:serine/threonine-protein kinase n=1 Tax=Streptomyces sp. bgisy154 TaxID=3413794 RepID=UPI003D75CB48